MVGWSKRVSLALSTATFLGAGNLRAAEPLPQGWLEGIRNERGQRCELRGEQASSEHLLLACGSAGVWEIAFDAAGPHFARSFAFEGDVSGFFVEADGRVWVKLTVQRAQPLDGALPAAATAPAAVPSLPSAAPPLPPPARPAAEAKPKSGAERRVGRVVSEKPGEVVISLGAADGISRSDRIELALEHKEDWARDVSAVSKEAIAVGVVINVTEHHAKVRLGLNEAVPVGAVAIPTRAATTASNSGPPRVTDVWELELMARPFAAIGELGGGVLLSGGFGRRLGKSWRVGAVLDPLAVADVENRESVGAANAAIFGSYDSQYLEMGLGFGAQTVNETDPGLEAGSGLTLAQIIRLGAEDGLNLSARTSIVLFHQEFDFGGMVGTVQIPVTRGYWLLLGGGGGNVGYGYGELGLRVLMSGNGLAGSTFLTTTAGGAAVFRSGYCDADAFICNDSVGYGGPMAGIGGEWRF
jgi:hypothetical protein